MSRSIRNQYRTRRLYYSLHNDDLSDLMENSVYETDFQNNWTWKQKNAVISNLTERRPFMSYPQVDY